MSIRSRKLAKPRWLSPFFEPQDENPYLADEYADFKRWLAEFAAARGVPFANLEDAVPAGDWGETEDGPDFKHFKGAGHRLTVEAILAQLGPALRRAATLVPAPSR